MLMQLGNSANLVSASLVCVMTTAGADDTMETFFFSRHTNLIDNTKGRATLCTKPHNRQTLELGQLGLEASVYI